MSGIKKHECCQHASYRWADVEGLRFSICNTCGHKWLEIPL